MIHSIDRDELLKAFNEIAEETYVRPSPGISKLNDLICPIDQSTYVAL